MKRRGLADFIRDLLGLPSSRPQKVAPAAKAVCDTPLPSKTTTSTVADGKAELGTAPAQAPTSAGVAAPSDKADAGAATLQSLSSTPAASGNAPPLPSGMPKMDALSSLPSKRSEIEWGPVSQVPKLPPVQPLPPKDDRRIDWGGGTGRAIPDLATLIGIEDAFDHTVLREGEQIAFCLRDKVAYHLSTWQFLQDQNHGRCCVCGGTNVITLVRLPGTFVAQPVPIGSLTVPSILRPGEKPIGLKQIYNYVNRAAVVEDFVYGVHRSQKGTYFVQFEPRRPGMRDFDGFKVVIRPRYVPAWRDARISVESYANQYICVRGVIQVHSFWGIEILVNSPHVIQIMDKPAI